MSRWLIEAVEKGDLEKVRELLEAGADVDWQRKKDGITALNTAALGGDTEIARLLLEYGASVDRPDTADDQTPLYLACAANHTEMARLLLESGADVHARTRSYQVTSLMQAARNGNTALIRLLLETGADVHAVSTASKTALHFARENRHARVEKILLAAGAPIPPEQGTPARLVPGEALGKQTSANVCDYREPASVLCAFIHAMNRWEQEAAKIFAQLERANDSTVLEQRMLAAMQQVFERYCTTRTRPYGRNGSFQTPPEYDPASEVILSVETVESDRAIILTHHVAREMEYRYILYRKGGKWLVDNKKIRGAGGDWLAWSL